MSRKDAILRLKQLLSRNQERLRCAVRTYNDMEWMVDKIEELDGFDNEATERAYGALEFHENLVTGLHARCEALNDWISETELEERNS